MLGGTCPGVQQGSTPLVAGRMVGKDGDVVRAGCVRGGGGAGDCGGGRTEGIG